MGKSRCDGVCVNPELGRWGQMGLLLPGQPALLLANSGQQETCFKGKSVSIWETMYKIFLWLQYTCTHVSVHRHTHALTHWYLNADTYILTHTWTHRHAHKHTHRHTHIHARRHTQSHASTQIFINFSNCGSKSACSVVYVSCSGLSRNWQWKHLPKRQRLCLQLHSPGHWTECLAAGRTHEYFITLKAPLDSWPHGIGCLLPQRGFHEGEGREGQEVEYYAVENLRQSKYFSARFCKWHPIGIATVCS